VGERAERELASALGPARAVRAARQLREASRAFERERFSEARAVLRPLAEQAPSSASVRELLGLTYYRLGRWKLAIKELEAFASLTSSTEQHPILADSYRALGRWARVDELWDELREASPGADLVAEGRIVLAGSMADRGDVAGAIAVLEKAKTQPQRPKPHHLRMAYALADLRERAGDVAGARALFGWIAAQDPQVADAAERAGGLG
jgi:tetratricopeptide (TPR) repeat protein